MLHQMPRAAAPAPEISDGPSATVALAELRLAANRLGRVIEHWNTIPALGCVRVRFKDDQLTLEATDLKMSLALDLEAQTSGRADLVVSHRALAGFLRAARGPVTITHMRGEDHDRVRLSDGEIQVTLQLSIPPRDFPRPVKDPDGMRGTGAFTLSGAQALRLFDLGRSCVSREETRYYLNGTFLTTKPEVGTLRAVSTDGHRMAIIDCDEPARFIEGPRADGSKATDRPDGLIVPVRAVDLLIAIARKAGNAPLTFAADARHLLVTAPGLRLVIQGIDGTYPDYTRVTPPASDAFTAHLSASALSRLRTIASATCYGRSLPLRLDPDAGRMSLTMPDGVDLSIALQGQTTKDGQTATYSLALLSEFARIAPAFTLSSAGRGEPARIVTEDPEALWVLMPMRD
ncbi:DNA polymerase III subunit beta [Pseudooceanicola marinus]|uniref:Beta sliding clamp n=2 Tax=Pseudooceanicola marinus TaxID=396013 RepID=A0A1X7AB95_9RHOB|nr:DNA polymerase III subunit beta [Pseudooceanicola marinus]SLN74620.1 DNA polymerase III subunit beta [Pseudooceanicola marinus]